LTFTSTPRVPVKEKSGLLCVPPGTFLTSLSTPVVNATPGLVATLKPPPMNVKKPLIFDKMPPSDEVAADLVFLDPSGGPFPSDTPLLMLAEASSVAVMLTPDPARGVKEWAVPDRTTVSTVPRLTSRAGRKSGKGDSPGASGALRTTFSCATAADRLRG